MRLKNHSQNRISKNRRRPDLLMGIPFPVFHLSPPANLRLFFAVSSSIAGM